MTNSLFVVVKKKLLEYTTRYEIYNIIIAICFIKVNVQRNSVKEDKEIGFY